MHFSKLTVHLQLLRIEPPIHDLLKETVKRDLLLIDHLSEEERKNFLSNQDNLKSYIVSCICSVKGGFVIGFAGIGLIMIYIINKETDLLYLKAHFSM